MKTVSYIFLGLFVLASGFELCASFFDNKNLRKITKPFCLLFLMLFAIVTLNEHPYLYMGCLMGFLGDIFLLGKKNKLYFALGTFAFLIGHVFYSAEIITTIFPILGYTPDRLFFVIYIGLIFATGLLLIPASYKVSKNYLLSALGSYYFTCLFSINGLAIFGFILGNIYSVMTLVGGLLFVFSDILIAAVQFMNVKLKRPNFIIMMTYLLGQFLIVFSLILTTI